MDYICRPNLSQTPASKGTYSQVGFSYDGDGKEDPRSSDDDDEDDDEEDEDDDEEFNSDDSGDERMETIAKDFGVKRYGWLVYMDKKAKEEEKRQKEVIKGDPAIVSAVIWMENICISRVIVYLDFSSIDIICLFQRKLSRKERRKVSQLEREKEREAARVTGTHVLHHDPYR